MKSYGFSMGAAINDRKKRAAAIAAAEDSTEKVLAEVRAKSFAKLPDNYEFMALLLRKAKSRRLSVQDIPEGWLVSADRRG